MQGAGTLGHIQKAEYIKNQKSKKMTKKCDHMAEKIKNGWPKS